MGFEAQLNPGAAEEQPVIGTDRFKKFIVLSSAIFFLVNANLFVAVAIYVYDQRAFSEMFANYSSKGNGYDIFAAVMIPICLAALSVPFIARKGAKFVLLLVVYICHLYLSMFLLRLSIKVMNRYYDGMLTGYTVFFSGAFGLLVNSLITSRKFNPNIGTIVGTIVGAISILLYINVFKLYNPMLWKVGLYFGGIAVYSWYLNTDAKFMIERRNQFYRVNDFVMGAAHFFTDIFFRFWYDLIIKPKAVVNLDQRHDSDATAATLNL